jgi:hypothetical protein
LNPWTQPAPFRYDIPVPTNVAYSVQLHFAEITYQTRINLERMDPTRRDSQPVNDRSVFHRVGDTEQENPNIRAIENCATLPLRRTPPLEVDPVWTAQMNSPRCYSQLGG